jgi:hypothetical protein
MHPAGRLLAAVTLLALPLADASAQPEAIPVGTRVRVRAPGVIGGGLIGPVVARSTDTLTVRAPDAQWRAIPMTAITRLERSAGRSRTQGMQRGALRGTGLAIGLGLLNLGFSDRTCDEARTDCVSPAEGMAAWAAIGLVIGAGVGAAVGSERWERVPLR